ncbi:MAG: DUF2508 family protein [Clostridia bacterium]|nr:DUF2508 family protein [Clostridia bacterium]
MQEEFIKDRKIIDKTDVEKEIELVRNIIAVKKELKAANENFEFVEDELIDYYTYKIKANQSKLNYLIRQAKIKGITIDMINQIKIKLYNEELDAG